MTPAVVGGLAFACVAALGVALVTVRERWHELWFELEDPRPMALFRIVFAFLLLCNVNGLWEHFAFLFTADGLFTGAEARALFSGDSVLSSASFLYVWDSRAAFWIHLGAFECAAILFIIGAWTRASGVATFVLMESSFVRNPLFWEGTELVYRVFLVYLICSRCGEAYSVDRWRRRSSEPSVGYRGIPAWPRRLVILQLAALFASTGFAKSGDGWIAGNAVYYLLSHDHLPRVPMATACALLGTNVMRVATWMARAIEVGFPLVLVGVLARWSRARFPPLVGTRRRIVRACFVVFVLASGLVVSIVGGPAIVATRSHWLATACWWALWIGVWIAWQLGRTRPAVLDWCFGRRIWAAAAIALMLALWMLVNIGQFHTGVLACFVPLLSGAETDALVRRLARIPRRLGLLAVIPRESVAVSGGLAYSRLGRAGMSLVLACHCLAVAVELVPASDATNGFREPLRVVTRPRLMVTRTMQSWNMWAPDAPREVTLLRVVVIDRTERAWDMRTDVYAAERNPVPWIAYDRSRKMARRILSSGVDGPYQRPYARWHCREWARTHDGEVPMRVELRAVSRTIPTPELARARDGASEPFGPDVVVLSHDC